MASGEAEVRRARRRRAPAFARRAGPGWLFALAACADLRPLEGDVCGNGVVERGEDCDRFAAAGASCWGPAEEGACRYACGPAPAGAEGPRCPPGFGCGADRTCRRPSGAFEPGGERVAEGASVLRVADFDGDGRDDVLALGAANERGERAARVIFRDAEGFGASRRVPNVFRSVAIGPLGPGAAQGLALISGQSSLVGLDLLVGDRDRSFASLVNPVLGGGVTNVSAAGRLVGVDALPRRLEPGEGGATLEFNQGDEVVLMQPTFAGTGSTLYAIVSSPKELPANASNPGFPVVTLLTLGVSAEGSGGGVAVGRFSAPGVGAPCEDVAWAPSELAEVYLLAPCRFDPPEGGPGARVVWNEAGIGGRLEPRRVALPGGARPAAGAARWLFVADANGDGVSDLALMTEQGPFVAFGLADGAAPTFEPVGVFGGQALLAFGDLNGDKAPDWVFDDGIVLSEPGAPLGVVRVRAPARWSDALVDDFNGDGRPDAVTVGPEARSLDYYLGAPGGLFNPFSVPIEGVASRLAAGDFDGDAVVDVAFALGESAGARADAVFIAFGGRAPSASAPLRVGELRGVRQIAAASYGFGGAELDGADDLGLVGAPDDGGPALAALLFGNAERQPRSPLIITSESDVRPWAVAAGRFVAGAPGAPAPLGLAMLAGSRLVPDRPFSLWLSSPSGESGVTRFAPPVGSAGPGEAATALPAEVDPAPEHGAPASQGAGELPELLAGDLDGDGVDEALALVPGRGGGATLAIARARAAGGAPMLFVDRVLGGLPRSTLAGLADVDGDGAPDLVVLSPAGEGGPNLSVYWNTAGAFDPAGAVTRVELPSGPAASWAAPRAPAGAPLFAVNAAGAYAVDFRAGRAARVEALRGVEGGEAIAAGDVTGDGVVDLVVGDGRSIRLARGEPARP